MSNQFARAVFKRRFGDNPNLLTPHVIGYYVKGGLAIELSSGEGIDGKTIYGVTVLSSSNPDDDDLRKNLSGCFPSREKADAHIAQIKKL